MIAAVRLWLAKRRLDRAQALIERCGLTVVKLQTVAGTTYLINADGTAMRLAPARRRK